MTFIYNSVTVYIQNIIKNYFLKRFLVNVFSEDVILYLTNMNYLITHFY